MKKWIFAAILLLGAVTVLPSCDILLGTTTTTNNNNNSNSNTTNRNTNNNSNTSSGSNTSRGKVIK